MSPAVQDLVVALLVLASVLYSLWRLLSVRLRLRVLDFLEPALGKVASGPLQQLRSKTLGLMSGGGCSACSEGASHLRAVKR